MEDTCSGYQRSSPLITFHSEELKLQQIYTECLLHASHMSKCLYIAVDKTGKGPALVECICEGGMYTGQFPINH